MYALPLPPPVCSENCQTETEFVLPQTFMKKATGQLVLLLFSSYTGLVAPLNVIVTDGNSLCFKSLTELNARLLSHLTMTLCVIPPPTWNIYIKDIEKGRRNSRKTMRTEGKNKFSW